MNSSTYVLIVCVTVSYMEQILSVGKPEDFKTIKANIEGNHQRPIRI